MSVDFAALFETPYDELVAMADELGVENPRHFHKQRLVFQLAEAKGRLEQLTYGCGVLDVHGEGFGFLRNPLDNFLPGSKDIYVSQSQIRRFNLRTGDTVIGVVRPPKDGERYLALLRIESVNDEIPGVDAPTFDSLTSIYPDDHIDLGTDPTLKAIDLVAPLGLGQRGIIYGPHGTGHQQIMRALCHALSQDDDLMVSVLLVGERPEDIAEWGKTERAEIIATPFDSSPSRHTQVADILFERARRMVERGDNIVILVDSLSKLLRYCITELPPSGKQISGVDVTALDRLRNYLGSARAFEEGGSLTVIGVCSGDPNTPAEQVLRDEMRSISNWEVTLSAELAKQGVTLPIVVRESGTREEARLLNAKENAARAKWRASLTGDPREDATALNAHVNDDSAT